MAAGTLVAVVGPSGAGKDTLIAHARAVLGEDPGFHFVRRLVTRPSNRFEDHDTIDEDDFASGMAEGTFALAWRAHGLGYALPATLKDRIAEGAVAVSNLSRGALKPAETRFANIRIVLVTAPEEVLAARLAARGRESLESVSARLRRAAEQAGELKPHLVIVNDRPIEETGSVLVSFLEGLRVGANA